MQKDAITRPRRTVKKTANTTAQGKLGYTDSCEKTTAKACPSIRIPEKTKTLTKTKTFRTGLSEKILTSIDEAFILTDNFGRIYSTNKKLQELLGYSNKELMGKSICEVIGESSEWDDIISWAPSSRIDRYGTTLKTRTEVRIPVDVSIIPYTDKASSRNFTIILTKDLRQAHRLSKELETTKNHLAQSISSLEEFREGVLYMLENLDHSEKKLQEANLELRETQAQLVQTTKLKALGELTAGLAHELNQPLTVIRAISQHLINDFDKDSVQVEKLKFINSATQKMEKTISHLKAFSRLDDHVMVVINLNDVINNSLLLISEILKSKSIKIKLNLQKIPTIKGQPNRLEQVIINLMTNARDAMPAGGVIELTSSCVQINDKPHVLVTFKDSGSGIPDEIKERIFEPFFTTKDISEGTGLGLSISYGIIKDHMGDIWFESTNKGTTFHISVPASSEEDDSKTDSARPS
jgi:PAS domain S-box-containing protein